MTPISDSWGAFGHAPALTLGYAMSACGVRFSIERLWRRHVGATDLPLDWFADFLSGKLAFDTEGTEVLVADDLPDANFRTVSRAARGQPHDAHLVVQRFADGVVDLFHAWV